MMVYGFSGVQLTDCFMEFVGSAKRPLWSKSMENSQQAVSKQTIIIFYSIMNECMNRRIEFSSNK